MIEAELPDGTVLEFPDGTEQDVIQRVVKGRLGVSAEPKPEAKGLGATVGNALMQIPYGVNEALGSLASGAEYAADVALGPLYDRESRDSGPLSSLLLNDKMTGPAPEGRLQRVMRSGGNMLGATAPTMGLPVGPAAQSAAQALSKAPGATKQAVAAYLQAYGKNPATMLAGDAAGALGAGMGGELAGDAGAPRIVGELAGGVAGGFAASGGLTGTALRGGKRLAGKISPEAQKAAARDYVKARVGDELGSESAQANLARSEQIREVIPEFEPRLGEASGVPSLIRTQEELDKSLRGQALDVITSRQAGSQQAVNRFADQAAPQGVGDAERALAPAQQRVQGMKAALGDQAAAKQADIARIKARNDELKALLQGRREQAGTELSTVRQGDIDQQLEARDMGLAQTAEEARVRDAAQEAFRQLDSDVVTKRRDIASELGGRGDKAERGSRIRSRLNEVRSERSQQMTAMADEMGLNDADFTTPFARFVQKVDEAVTPKSAFEEPLTIPKAYSNIMGAKALPNVSFKDVKTLRERVGRDIRAASGANDGASKIELRNLVKIQKLIDDELLVDDPFDPRRWADDLIDPVIDEAASLMDTPQFGRIVQAMKGRGTSKPQSLSQFIRSKGGLKDYNGEIANVPELKTFSRPNTGQEIDEATLRAWEAGYFPEFQERPMINDLIAALQDDASGVNPRYSDVDANLRGERDELADLGERLGDSLLEMGVPRDANTDQIRAAIRQAQGNTTSAPGIPESLVQNYKKFRQTYFEQYIEPFERSATSKVRRKDGKSFHRTLDEDVASSFISTQDGAKQYASLFKDRPEAIADVEAALLDDLADSALVDGVLRYSAFERWINGKRGVLKEFPEVAAKFDDLFTRVKDTERYFAETKDAIGSSKADALAQIGQSQRLARQKALDSRKSTTEQQRQIESARDADINAMRAEQEALQQSLAPLESRLETLVQRQRSIDKTALGRKLNSLANETTTPEQLVNKAIADSRQMIRLIAATRGDDEAKRALQRTVWDKVADKDGATIASFIDKNENSLKMLLGEKHLKDLRIIQDARQIMDRAPEPRGAPIGTDPVKQITEATGLNPQASIARYVNVQRGRSSKAVELGSGLAYWFGRARKNEADSLLRAALDDPNIARKLIEELSAPAVREGRKPPRLTRIWALNAALGNDGNNDNAN